MRYRGDFTIIRYAHATDVYAWAGRNNMAPRGSFDPKYCIAFFSVGNHDPLPMALFEGVEVAAGGPSEGTF